MSEIVCEMCGCGMIETSDGLMCPECKRTIEFDDALHIHGSSSVLLAAGCVVRNIRQTMKKLLAVIMLVGSIVCVGAQTNATLMGTLAGLLNPEDPNGLLNADELNASVAFIHKSDENLNGGEFRLDWWIGKQAGMMFAYDEYGDRSAYWKLGAQVRTVFKQAEFSLSTGTRQNVDENFGQVDMFVEPALTFRVVNTDNWDVRIFAAVDFVAGESKPDPIVGITCRFLRF